jgi:hypothetical protein
VPEKKENKVEAIGSFKFSSDIGGKTVPQLEMQVEALQNRIDTLSTKTAINGPHGPIGVLNSIIDLCGDDEYEVLIPLGRALERVASILPELDEARSKLEAARYLMKNPEWVASVFGDFSTELESLEGDFSTELESLETKTFLKETDSKI